MSACSVVLVVLGILIGLSLNVPSLRYFDVYAALLDSLYIIIGMLVSGGTIGYVATRGKE